MQPLLDEACRTHVTLAAGNYARLGKPDEVGSAMPNDPFVYALAAEVSGGPFNGKSDWPEQSAARGGGPDAAACLRRPDVRWSHIGQYSPVLSPHPLASLRMLF